MKIRFAVIYFVLSILAISSCKKRPASQDSFVIMSMNDVYRTEGLNNGESGGLARVTTLRQKINSEQQPVLVLHGGDFLYPSFSSRVNSGAEMIDIMNQLDNSDEFDNNFIATFGNHEFDKGRMKHVNLLQDRINESKFLWLDSNINWVTNTIQSEKFNKWIIKDIGGIKVGLFSVTTDMVHPEYISSFDDPLEVTRHYVPFLKSKGAEFIIALTHQRMGDDVVLLELESQFRPDIIIGGHEHYRQLKVVNEKWIVKADADAASVAVVEIKRNKQDKIDVFPTIVDLDESVEKNNRIDDKVKSWRQQTHVKFCQKLKLDSNCLEQAYGFTKVELVAEESEIRRFETNFGNFIADAAAKEFENCEADGAFINSGSIRLNYNIAAKSPIQRLHIEGIFAYPSNLKLIEINGKTLKQMIEHSISMWTANGHWLLVSGVRFVHNPEKQIFEHLVWAKNGKLIQDYEKFKVVVPQYLIDDNTDHDGYMMISEKDVVQSCSKNTSSLKNIVIKSIKGLPNGLNPQKDGRICNTLRDQCNK